MWAKLIKYSKLEFKLMFKVISSGFICILLYISLVQISGYYIDHLKVDLDRYKDQLNSTAVEFQEYIKKYEITLKDINAIRAWDKTQKTIHIKLIENNKVIYDSLDYFSRMSQKVSYIYYEPAKDFFHTIEFSDGQAVLYINILYKQKIEEKVDYIIAIFCILLFFGAIMLEFRKLVRDILSIKKGIQILEGGNLAYELKSKRNDEITDLAESINGMSKELDRQIKEDEKLQIKNYELVTSISHDIKTPLTTVNSYIDLIMEKKYKDQAEMERYLEKIKAKSVLINDLVDNLFTHFLNKNTDYQYNFETITGNDFIRYLLDGLKEGLNDKGYQVFVKYDFNDEFFLKADVVQIQRVFNNLEGNLIKYARKSMPIIYSAELRDKIVIIQGENYIVNKESVDSHGVGIVNSQSIIKKHSGEMITFIQENKYHVIIHIPTYQLENIPYTEKS